MRALLILALLPLAVPASAEHCWGYTTSAPELDVGLPNEKLGSDRYYVDVYIDMGPGGGFPSPWIYEESNGIDGLQRGDELIDDTCHGMIAPDKLIF